LDAEPSITSISPLFLMASFTGYGQIGTPTAYLMGGGTIGGPNVWDFSYGYPELSQAARQAGTITLPAGALSRQEIRNRQDVQQAMMSGMPYVEMPTMYQLNERGQYIDPLTGRSMGTVSINYSAGGWRNAKEEEMASGGGYSPNVQARRAAQGRNPYGPESGGYKEFGGPQPAQKPSPAKATEIKKTELGESGGALAFTPFGERVRQESQPQPKAGSPFPAGTIGSLTGFGGIPLFPYANY